MTNRALLTRLFLVALLALPVAAFAADGPRVEEEEFTLVFPSGFGEVKQQKQTVKSPSGPIDQITYISQGESGVAIVTYSELSDVITDPEATIEGGQDSLLKSLKATLENATDKEVSGQSARTVLFSATEPRPLFARTDFVVVGPRLYQLIYLGYDQQGRTQPEVVRFFESFNVTAPAPAVTATEAPKVEAESETASIDQPQS